MVLKFSIDSQTGVVKPPVTVFNGGAKRSKSRKSKKLRKARKTQRKRR